MILKKDSEAWQLALKLSRRKYIHWTPLHLNEDGSVKVRGLIRGNEWTLTLQDLQIYFKELKGT